MTSDTLAAFLGIPSLAVRIDAAEHRLGALRALASDLALALPGLLPPRGAREWSSPASARYEQCLATVGVSLGEALASIDRGVSLTSRELLSMETERAELLIAERAGPGAAPGAATAPANVRGGRAGAPWTMD